MIPEITPKSLERVGSRTPRNIISSNKGAKRVVVKNKESINKLIEVTSSNDNKKISFKKAMQMI